MSTKITITVNGKKMELEPSEARRIWSELANIFGDKPWVLAPYIPPIIIDRTPPHQPWVPNPWGTPSITCRNDGYAQAITSDRPAPVAMFNS